MNIHSSQVSKKSLHKGFRGWLPMAFLGSAFVLDIAYGSVTIPLTEVMKALLGVKTSNPVWFDIIWDFRMTKAITCLLAGGGLSLGGLLMQTFFRNPLAGPDVLGLSSGASLAVSLLLLGDQWLGGYLSGSWAVVIAASVGCSAVFLLVVTFAARVRDSASLLIIGLMVGAATASIVSVIQFQSQADSLQTFVIWTFGNVGSLNWVELAVMGIVVLVGSILALLIVKSLNAWLLGDAYLVSLGINIKRTKFIIIICTSILAGSITAFCGPIAFIGLAVPHVVKMIVPSADHRVLIPYCLIMGATILLACDVLSQLSPGNGALPLNAVTALFGAPVVVWIILKGRVIRA